MDQKEILKVLCAALEDKKGNKLSLLDVSKVSYLADYFIIVSGNNTSHISALSENAIEKASEIGLKPIHTEGTAESGWILVDYGNIVVHVFSTEAREFYDLERVWKDAVEIKSL